MDNNYIKGYKQQQSTSEYMETARQTGKDYMEKYAEGGEVRSEYLKKSASLGWEKAKDWTNILVESLNDPSNIDTLGGVQSEDVYTPEEIKKIKEEYSLKQEQSRLAVKQAMEERDSFYISNTDKLGMVDTFAGGLIESVVNPYEVITNIGVGAITGGASLPVQLGAQAYSDVKLNKFQTKRYEERDTTLKEDIATVATSIVPDLAMGWVGKQLAKLSATPIKVKSGGVDVDARASINNHDNALRYNGSKQQQMFTDHGSNIGIADPYKADNLTPKKLVNIITDYYSNKTIEPQINKFIKQNLKEQGLSDLQIKDRFKEIHKMRKEISSSKTKKHASNTVLQRHLKPLESGIGYVEGLSNKGIINNDQLSDFFNGMGVQYNPKKDITWNLTKLSQARDTTTSDFANTIAPEVKDFYDRWGKEKTKLVSKGDYETNPNVVLNTNLIDEGIKNIDARYETQKMFASAEYMNKANLNRGDKPYLNGVEDLANEFDKESKSIAEAFINGTTKAMDDGYKTGTFLTDVYNDSIELDQLGMRVNLNNMAEYDYLMNTYGSSFDIETGTVKFDGRLHENLAKAKNKSEDMKVLLNAMKDSPEEYAEFIFNSKEVLNGGKGVSSNKELLDKANSELANLKEKKSLYKKEYYDNKIDAINDIFADNSNKLNEKILDKKNKIETLLKSKKKGYKKKIEDLNLDIEDLNVQLKNEDLLRKEKTSKLKESFDKNYLDKEIELKKQYIEKLNNVKDYISDSEKLRLSKLFDADYDTIKKYIKRNKDFINSEYDKIVKDIPIEQGKDIKIWKREVAESLANKRKANALESIKINQTVNKQNMYGYLDSFFEEGINKNNVGTVKLKEGMSEAFNESIMPFYDNGILKQPKDGDYVRNFAEFINDFKKTRKEAKWTSEYKTIGELREYFEDKKMSEFFTSEFKLPNKDETVSFLKNNADMLRDIFDYQTGEISRYLEYGSTSPYVLRNKLTYGLKKEMPNVIGKELSQAESKAVNTAISKINTYLENTHLGYLRPAPTGFEKGARTALNVVRRGILSFTGIPELYLQNYAITSARAIKYGGIASLMNDIEFNILKIARNLTGDLPDAKFNVAQLMKDLDTDSLRKVKGWDAYDKFAFSMQDGSGKQFFRYGDAKVTSILYYLPENFDRLDNNMKSLFRTNGIDEKNYSNFAKNIKNHIDSNGLTVNMSTLAEASDRGDALANSTRNIYYRLTDYVGNVMSDSKLQTKNRNIFSDFYGLFRSYARSMNADLGKRFVYYTDAKGLSKNRFLHPINYYKDMGARGITNDATSFAVVGGLLVASGLSYTYKNELTSSNRTYDQKLALLETKAEALQEATVNLLTNGEVLNFIKEATKQSGVNPFETFSPTDLSESLTSEFNKIWNTFSDEEKKVFGTNNKEGFMNLLDFSFKYLGSRILNNVGKSMYKDFGIQTLDIPTGSIETLKKVWDLSPEQQIEYESRVRAYAHDKQVKLDIANDRKAIKAKIDFSENNLDTYNAMTTEKKVLTEQIIEDNQDKIDDPDKFKSESALAFTHSKNTEEFSVYMSQTNNIDVKKSIPAAEAKMNSFSENSFEKLTDKRKRLFYMIMAYKGVKNITDEDKAKFMNEFLGNKEGMEKPLKDVYNINIEDFENRYSTIASVYDVLKLYNAQK